MQIVIIILGSLVLISFVGSIFEDNSIRRFSAFFYKHGVPIYKKIIPAGNFNILPGEKNVITKNEGVFYFTDEGLILFRPDDSNIRTFRLRTPLAFKAMGIIKEVNFIEITARLPLSFSILLASWTLLGIVFIAIFPAFGIIFVLFPLVLFLLSFFVEKGRMKRMVVELEEILATQGRTVK